MEQNSQLSIPNFDGKNTAEWFLKIEKIFTSKSIENAEQKYRTVFNSLPEPVREAYKDLPQTIGEDYSGLKNILIYNSMLQFLDCDTPSTFYYRLKLLLWNKLSPSQLFCYFFDMLEENIRSPLEKCETVARLKETTPETVENDAECLRELLEKADCIHYVHTVVNDDSSYPFF